jgi:hypothetical protein
MATKGLTFPFLRVYDRSNPKQKLGAFGCKIEKGCFVHISIPDAEKLLRLDPKAVIVVHSKSCTSNHSQFLTGHEWIEVNTDLEKWVDRYEEESRISERFGFVSSPIRWREMGSKIFPVSSSKITISYD